MQRAGLSIACRHETHSAHVIALPPERAAAPCGYVLANQCSKRTLCHDVRGYHGQVPAVHHRPARVSEVSILVSGDCQRFSAYKQRPDFLERAWPFSSPCSSIGIGISVNVRNSCKRRRRECSFLVAIRSECDAPSGVASSASRRNHASTEGARGQPDVVDRGHSTNP